MSAVSIETKVAVMEDAINRYEDAIAKLVEVSQDLKQMLAVHEIRHQERERAEMTLKNEIDKENNILHGRINNLSAETKKELESQYDELLRMLKSMHEENCTHHKKVEDSITDLKANEIAPLKVRLSSLERWRWLIVGGGVVLAGILYNIPWQNFIGS